MSDSEIEDFNKRMKGATVGEELNGIGSGDAKNLSNDDTASKYAQQSGAEKFVFWDSYSYTCYALAEKSTTTYGWCKLSDKTLSKSTSSDSNTSFVGCSYYPHLENIFILL